MQNIKQLEISLEYISTAFCGKWIQDCSLILVQALQMREYGFYPGQIRIDYFFAKFLRLKWLEGI